MPRVTPNPARNPGRRNAALGGPAAEGATRAPQLPSGGSLRRTPLSGQKTAMITARAMTIECENYNKETKHEQRTHAKEREPKKENCTTGALSINRKCTTGALAKWYDLAHLGRHGKAHQNQRAPQSETVGRVGDGGESWGRPLKDPPDLGNIECLDNTRIKYYASLPPCTMVLYSASNKL